MMGGDPPKHAFCPDQVVRRSGISDATLSSRASGSAKNHGSLRVPDAFGRVWSYRRAGSTPGIAGLDEIREDLPDDAGFALDALGGQLDAPNRQIVGIDVRLTKIHKVNAVCRLLATIPGIGAISATALAATIPDPSAFRSGREFAAWLGLTPCQNSSGGSLAAYPSKVIGIFAIC